MPPILQTDLNSDPRKKLFDAAPTAERNPAEEVRQIVPGKTSIQTRQDQQFLKGDPELNRMLEEQSSPEQPAAMEPSVAEKLQAVMAVPNVMRTGSAQFERETKKGAEQIRSQATAFAAEAKQAGQDLKALQESSARATEDAIAAQQKFLDSLAGGAPSIRAEVERSQQNFRQANEALQKSTFDPGKLINSMPRWAQAITVVATSFDALNRSFGGGRGTPPVAAIVNAAIRQDQQEQLRALDVRMQQLGVADNQRRFALRRMEALQGQQRQAAMAMSQLRLAGIAAQTDNIKTKLDVTRNSVALGSTAQLQAAQLQRAGQRGTISNVPYKLKAIADIQAAQQKSAATMKPDKEQLRKDEEALTTARTTTPRLASIFTQLKEVRDRSGGGALGGGIQRVSAMLGYTDAAALQGDIQEFAIQMAKAANGGRPADKDQIAAAAALGGIFSNNASTRRRARARFGTIVDGLEARAKTAAQFGRTPWARALDAEAKKTRALLLQIEGMF